MFTSLFEGLRSKTILAAKPLLGVAKEFYVLECANSQRLLDFAQDIKELD